jgi:hypothetical protein
MLDLVTLTLRVVNVDRSLLLTLTPAVSSDGRVTYQNYLRYVTRTHQTIQTLFASLTHGLWTLRTQPFQRGRNDNKMTKEIITSKEE